MARRRRNKLVLWEWSPEGKPKDDTRRKRPPSVGREALGAIALVGGLIFLISLIPPSPDGGYRRGQLAEFMCETAGVSTGSAACFGVSIAGWFAIVIAIGITLMMGRLALRSVGGDRDES